jgi:protein required for attachment to host cells
MSTRILVADESEARLYAQGAAHEPPRRLQTLQDPLARLHEREFKSDRPGRVFDHAAPAGGRRGAVAHHSTGGDHPARDHELHLFVGRMIAMLSESLERKPFDRLIIVAPPRVLGLLRAQMSDALQKRVRAEVAKDLIHESEARLREHLAEALQAG